MKKFNYYIGMAVSSWLLTILIISADLLPSFKALLVALFSHHWIGKAVIITLFFIASGLLFKEKKSHEKIAWYSTIGSLVVIFLFFVVEFFA